MLKSIKLDNFQSHKKSELEFVPGVNVIVGSSDSGKTAIFRAFRWLMYNRPLGDSFRSSWGGTTWVEVALSEGDTIHRWKDDSEHGYLVNGVTLKAFKTEVPEEVSSLLRMTDINFQRQFDRPFLLDESPGGVAAHFNRISNLEAIDRAVKNLNRKEKELRRNAQADNDRILRIEEELEGYSWIEEVEEMVSSVEALEDAVAAAYEEKLRIRTILGNLENFDKEEINLQSILKLEPMVKRVQKAIQQRNSVKEQWLDLLSKITQLQKWNKASKESHSLLQMELLVEKAEEKIKARNLKRKDLEELSGQVVATKGEEKNLNTARQNTLQAQQDFSTLFPDICPLCGSERKKV